MILIFGFMFVATGIAVVMTAKLKAQDELKEKEKR
jgi:hypothetical protein